MWLIFSYETGRGKSALSNCDLESPMKVQSCKSNKGVATITEWYTKSMKKFIIVRDPANSLTSIHLIVSMLTHNPYNSNGLKHNL